MDLKDALNLDTWEVVEELSSIHGPICPSCKHLLDQTHAHSSGMGKCPWCLQLFRWRTWRSPLGLTWSTRKEGGAP